MGGVALLYRASANGMRFTFTLERYGPGEPTPLPLPGGGTYAHLVISRQDRYPGWDEMRDFLKACELFHHDKEIFMVLPPEKDYLNIHPNAFHWYQKQG